jgi:hypothetical protein
MPGRAITQVCPQCEMPLVLPASFVGKTVPCSRCGHSVLVGGPDLPPPPALPVGLPPSGVPSALPGARPVPPHLANKLGMPLAVPPNPPGPPPPAPTPPHLQKAALAANPMSPAASAAPAADEATEEQPEPRSCLLSGCYVVGVAMFVLAGILGAALATVWISRQWQQPVANNGEEPGETIRGKKIRKKDYKDSSKNAITYSGVTVRIDKVQVGKVDFRSKGEILQTATPNYLIINVNVKNKNREEPVEYHSWYDNRFEDDAGNKQDVELIDDNGVELKLFRIPEAENVERHSKSDASLPMGDDITDSLIFKLPEGYLDEPIPAQYLKLPMVAVGETKDFLFYIPIIMIERRDK